MTSGNFGVCSRNFSPELNSRYLSRVLSKSVEIYVISICNNCCGGRGSISCIPTCIYAMDVPGFETRCGL